MAYIGKEPIVGNFQKCDAITVVNGQAAYTLQVSSTNVIPESANHMLVSLNGILQAPVTSFTVSSSTLTFASNLATGDVIDFVILLGNVLDLGTVSDGTITTAKIADDAVTYAKATGFGKVLQVVNATTTTQTDNNSSTYADTTLTADITCAATSSKVLVLAEVAGALHVAGDTNIDMKLLRDSTNLGFFAKNLGDTGTLANGTSPSVYYFSVGNVGVNYLDSPNSTSALTYKVQFMSSGNTTGVRVQSQSSMSSIALMEIGA